MQKLAEKKKAKIQKAAARQLAREKKAAAAAERRAQIEQNKLDRILARQSKQLAAAEWYLEYMNTNRLLLLPLQKVAPKLSKKPFQTTQKKQLQILQIHSKKPPDNFSAQRQLAH